MAFTVTKYLLINIRIEDRPDTPNGIPNGLRIFHASEMLPGTQAFRGCPLGRGPTEAAALEDFVRRGSPELDVPFNKGYELKLHVVERQRLNQEGCWLVNVKSTE